MSKKKQPKIYYSQAPGGGLIMSRKQLPGDKPLRIPKGSKVFHTPPPEVFALQAGRSPHAQEIDLSLPAPKLDYKQYKKWMAEPNRFDLEGVDTPNSKFATPEESPKAEEKKVEEKTPVQKATDKIVEMETVLNKVNKNPGKPTLEKIIKKQFGLTDIEFILAWDKAHPEEAELKKIDGAVKDIKAMIKQDGSTPKAVIKKTMEDIWGVSPDQFELAYHEAEQLIQTEKAEFVPKAPAKSAYEMGKEAYTKGKKAPAQDKEFLDAYIAGKPIGDPGSKKAMDEWTKGWHNAHIEKSDQDYANAIGETWKGKIPETPPKVDDDVPMPKKEYLGDLDYVEPGWVGTAYWTNTNNYYKAKAHILKVNEKSLLVELDEDIKNYKGDIVYPKGQHISVPRISISPNSKYSANNKFKLDDAHEALMKKMVAKGAEAEKKAKEEAETQAGHTPGYISHDQLGDLIKADALEKAKNAVSWSKTYEEAKKTIQEQVAISDDDFKAVWDQAQKEYVGPKYGKELDSLPSEVQLAMKGTIQLYTDNGTNKDWVWNKLKSDFNLSESEANHKTFDHAWAKCMEATEYKKANEKQIKGESLKQAIELISQSGWDTQDVKEALIKKFSLNSEEAETIVNTANNSLSSGGKPLEMTQVEWNKTPKDYKGYYNGVPHVLKSTEHGTAMVPVTIIKPEKPKKATHKDVFQAVDQSGEPIYTFDQKWLALAGDPTKGLRKDMSKNLETQKFIWGGLKNGVLLDGYVLLESPKAVEEMLGKYKKEEINRTYQIANGSMTKAECEESVNKMIAEYHGFPDYKKSVIPSSLDGLKEVKPFAVWAGQEGTIGSGDVKFTHKKSYGSPLVYLGSPDGNVTVLNANKFALAKKYLPNAKLMSSGPSFPVFFVEDGQIKGAVMPLMISEGESNKVLPGYIKEKAYAMFNTGKSEADYPAPTGGSAGTPALKPVDYSTLKVGFTGEVQWNAYGGTHFKGKGHVTEIEPTYFMVKLDEDVQQGGFAYAKGDSIYINKDPNVEINDKFTPDEYQIPKSMNAITDYSYMDLGTKGVLQWQYDGYTFKAKGHVYQKTKDLLYVTLEESVEKGGHYYPVGEYVTIDIKPETSTPNKFVPYDSQSPAYSAKESHLANQLAGGISLASLVKARKKEYSQQESPKESVMAVYKDILGSFSDLEEAQKYAKEMDSGSKFHTAQGQGINKYLLTKLIADVEKHPGLNPFKKPAKEAPAKTEKMVHGMMEDKTKIDGQAKVVQAVAEGKTKLPEQSIPAPTTVKTYIHKLDNNKVDWDKELEMVSGKKGSNEGGLYKNKSLQTFHYIKWPDDENRTRVEALTARLYELAGVPVPVVDTIKYKGKLALKSDWLDGAKPLTFEEMNGEADVKNNYAVDAWLANWDVAGTNADNIVKGKDGHAYRIDLGGSLIYRATGKIKSSFGEDVGEVESLANPSSAPYASKIFSGITWDQKKAGAKKVASVSDFQIDQAVDEFIPKGHKISGWGGSDSNAELKQILKKRRDYIIENVLKYEPPKPLTWDELKDKVKLKKASVDLILNHADQLTPDGSSSTKETVGRHLCKDQLGPALGDPTFTEIKNNFSHWKGSPGNPDGMAIRYGAGAYFGRENGVRKDVEAFFKKKYGEGSHEFKEGMSTYDNVVKERGEKNRNGIGVFNEAHKVLIRNQFANSVKGQEVPKVTIYRGWDADLVNLWGWQDAKVGDIIQNDHPVVYCCSFQKSKSSGFYGHGGMLVEMKIPVDNIILSDRMNNVGGGYSSEDEVHFLMPKGYTMKVIDRK